MAIPFFARRFVAGENLNDASVVVRDLNGLGLAASLDILGEDVADEKTARGFLTDYLEIADLIHGMQLKSYISIKLTMLGLLISDGLAAELLTSLLDHARGRGVFIRIDMEGSAITERTLQIFLDTRQKFDNVGIVLQSYLFRTAEDLERVLAVGGQVRLVKGAYKEPSSIAFQDMSAVRQNYIKLARVLLLQGDYHAFGTHDDSLIEAVRQMAKELGKPKTGFEFQMLYGLRRRTWSSLHEAGYNMRVYVPYGTQWFPYFSRRLRERKENVLFLLKNLVRS